MIHRRYNMYSPCKECSDWATVGFPECRKNCKKIDAFLEQAKTKYQPAFGEYVHIPYGETGIHKY
jgi:hypothetical protein